MKGMETTIKMPSMVCVMLIPLVLLASCAEFAAGLKEGLKESAQKPAEQTSTPSSFPGIELVGVYQTDLSGPFGLGIFSYSATVRNTTAQGKMVQIDFNLNQFGKVIEGRSRKQSVTLHVPPNDIAQVELIRDSKPPTDVRIVRVQ